jgi:hypothetical protein
LPPKRNGFPRRFPINTRWERGRIGVPGFLLLSVKEFEVNRCSEGVAENRQISYYDTQSIIMDHTVQLSEEFWKDVRRHANLNSRSITDQVEYWSRIGRIAEENPDLPYGFIRGVLLSRQEAGEGELSDYQFGSP